MAVNVSIVQSQAGDARRYVITFRPDDAPAFERSVCCSTQGSEEQQLAADCMSVGRAIALGRMDAR